MTEPATPPSRPSFLERWLPAAAAIACLILTVRIWQVIGRDQPMWPLPAAYLLEVLALAAAAGLTSALGMAVGALVTWIAVGAIAAFSVLAAFSVGMLYAPILLLLLVGGLLAAWRRRRRIPVFLAGAVVAALLEAGIILGVARLLS